ncbi:sialyltransferase [Chloropicon primus]|uniref:Sialyltransferase n=1 Tax=Chloropicon primus TaxID=1764295 RepID=A0A5B8MU47_9CHLO|nr:sialyltransferase [Chloropicon primus]UPR03516.1 sialyltransferase [Chloropicon primus]|eukprot:QDZ24308.1 sialyltransferase [Chloropicon primus]
MPGRPRVRVRLWLVIKCIALLCALVLVTQFASNVHSVHDLLDSDASESGGRVEVAQAAETRKELAGGGSQVELSSGEGGGAAAAGGARKEEVVVEASVPEETPGEVEGGGEQAKPPRPKKAWTLSELFQVMEDQQSFSRSEFGYSPELIVVTQENMERLRAHLSRPERFLPQTSPFVKDEGGDAGAEPSSGRRARYKSCALVGNAGIARAANFGETIDKHEAVLRINQGPSKGYEKIVGSKTTFRLLNKKWVSMYTSATEGRKVFLPSEAENATILASRISGRSFEHLASVVRHARKDLRLLYVAQGLESRARNLLKAFKEASLREQSPISYDGGDAPSSGFIGFYFLLQVCERVAIYAFSSQKLFGINNRSWPYHYFRFTQFAGLGMHLDSEQLREHPHHSFDAEMEFMAALSESTNRTRACMPRGQFTRSKLMKCGVQDEVAREEVSDEGSLDGMEGMKKL